MPTEDKKTVDIDTSGPGAEIDVEEQKDESVVEAEAPKEEAEAPKEEPVETKQETEEPKKEDDKLEEYSKGVQARIAKLTRKMREAERQRDAATEYARSVEEKRKALETRFEKTDADYIKKFEKSKGWLAKRISSENQIDKIANVIEERSIWQRYGL